MSHNIGSVYSMHIYVHVLYNLLTCIHYCYTTVYTPDITSFRIHLLLYIIYTIDAYYIYYRYTSYTLQFTATGHTRARKSVQNC